MCVRVFYYTVVATPGLVPEIKLMPDLKKTNNTDVGHLPSLKIPEIKLPEIKIPNLKKSSSDTSDASNRPTTTSTEDYAYYQNTNNSGNVSHRPIDPSYYHPSTRYN